MSNVLASVSIHTKGGVLNAPSVHHNATLRILAGLNVPTFATLVGRASLVGRGSVVRSSAVVSIHAHAQLPVAAGYSVASLKSVGTISAHATVLRRAVVSIHSAGSVSDTSRIQTHAVAGIAARSGVVAVGHRKIIAHAQVGGGAGIVGHARILAIAVDVIKVAASVVARLNPVNVQSHVGVAAGAKVTAVGHVSGTRVCHIGMRGTVGAGATVRKYAAEALRGGARVTATPHVSRQASVVIVAGLRGLLTARNLIGGRVGVATAETIHASEGRGINSKAIISRSIGVSAHATTAIHATVGIRTSTGLVARDAKRANATITVKAAAVLVANMIRSARGVTTIQIGAIIQAVGERNSLGGIQSTVTTTNPKGSVGPLGPTSTISVIP